MAFIPLNEKNVDETEVWLNAAHIVLMKRFENYTSVRMVESGGANAYNVSVLQFPEAIIARIKDAEAAD
jgi:hypothetical protein